VSVSIGIAVYPDHGLTSAGVLGAADDALYAAKAGGRDTFRIATPPGGEPTGWVPGSGTPAGRGRTPRSRPGAPGTRSVTRSAPAGPRPLSGPPDDPTDRAATGPPTVRPIYAWPRADPPAQPAPAPAPTALTGQFELAAQPADTGKPVVTHDGEPAIVAQPSADRQPGAIIVDRPGVEEPVTAAAAGGPLAGGDSPAGRDTPDTGPVTGGAPDADSAGDDRGGDGDGAAARAPARSRTRAGRPRSRPAGGDDPEPVSVPPGGPQTDDGDGGEARLLVSPGGASNSPPAPRQPHGR
jgi:hypothetical protein